MFHCTQNIYPLSFLITRTHDDLIRIATKKSFFFVFFIFNWFHIRFFALESNIYSASISLKSRTDELIFQFKFHQMKSVYLLFILFICIDLLMTIYYYLLPTLLWMTTDWSSFSGIRFIFLFFCSNCEIFEREKNWI